MSRRFLYRRLGSAVIAIVAFFVAVAPPGAAQMPQLKRPQDDAEEKPPEVKKKKVKGPRAIGLLQLNSSGKGSLIPIAILVDGKFYDASVYKADPVPMALETGTVYEVEQSGSSQGLFTINGALHSTVAGSVRPWTGTGAYLPNGTQAAKTTRKAEDVPVGLDSSDTDAPPRLTRGDTTKPAAATSPGSAPAAPPAAGSSDKPAATAPSQPAGASSGGGAPGQDAAKPATPPAKSADPPAKEPASKAEQATPVQAPPSQATASQTASGQAPPT
jgi:hypothetical protein